MLLYPNTRQTQMLHSEAPVYVMLTDLTTSVHNTQDQENLPRFLLMIDQNASQREKVMV